MLISYIEFKRMDIRIGTIMSCEKVEELDNLLKLIIDIGEEKRQIMAGIAQFVEDYHALVGKQVPILCNLEPRTFHGYESQGMLLAVDSGGRPILLHPEIHIPSGSIVR